MYYIFYILYIIVALFISISFFLSTRCMRHVYTVKVILIWYAKGNVKLGAKSLKVSKWQFYNKFYDLPTCKNIQRFPTLQ